MTHFPQPNPAKRASRAKLNGSVSVVVVLEGSQPVRAKLHAVSTTGGLLALANAFEQGEFVELAFQTSKGTVHGMAEILPSRCESSSGCLQPFRFVALDDEDHTRLCMALESLLDQTLIGVPSTKRHTF
jgi:hypothetical protein